MRGTDFVANNDVGNDLLQGGLGSFKITVCVGAISVVRERRDLAGKFRIRIDHGF